MTTDNRANHQYDNNTDNRVYHNQSCLTAHELENWCNNLLNSHVFKDYCPNGLQVDAGCSINHIVTGVTACEALIDAAIDAKAQAIMVHHGYFWRGEPEPLIGIKGRRIAKLFQHGISLLAYHLPLDAHPTLGNNAILAKQLGLTITGALYPEQSHPVGNIAQCENLTPKQLTDTITTQLARQPLHIATGKTQYKRIGLCTGAAQDMLTQAANMGCDAFISGEISERTTHEAKELGIDYFACGHHATEKGGIKTLGEKIAHELQLNVSFIDIDNPV